MNNAQGLPQATPEQGLSAGFAHYVERWARASGASEPACAAAREAAQAVSLATSQGHACLLLEELVAEARTVGPHEVLGAEGWRALLLDSGVVGAATDPGTLPLVLDPDNRLYLRRYFDHECQLAHRLLRAARAAPADVKPAAQALLSSLFARGAAADDRAAPALPRPPDWQKLAAALALRQRLLIISGGPGTGKTSTVVKILACLLAQDPDCRIALAAPTGKAAARMAEALHQRTAGLPEPLRLKLPTEAFTIHRLLGATPSPAVFQHHAGRPLAIDVLVVDEASMLDLALIRALLDAVPEAARIILLGDKDQLAAVESGAVFSDLSAEPGLSTACRHDLARLCDAEPETLFPALGAARQEGRRTGRQAGREAPREADQ